MKIPASSHHTSLFTLLMKLTNDFAIFIDKVLKLKSEILPRLANVH